MEQPGLIALLVILVLSLHTVSCLVTNQGWQYDLSGSPPRSDEDCVNFFNACIDYSEPGWPGNANKCESLFNYCTEYIKPGQSNKGPFTRVVKWNSTLTDGAKLPGSTTTPTTTTSITTISTTTTSAIGNSTLIDGAKVPGTTPSPKTCDEPKAVPINMISCTSSSYYSRGYQCKYAIDGVLKTNINSEGSAWASRGEGVGAWIKLQFSKPIEIKVIELLQRLREQEANREVMLTFDGNISESAMLPNKDSRHWNVIKLSRGVLTQSLKITITKVYGTVNNGFKEIALSGCF